ncbi:MAG: NAD(P)-dependent oxidoreductase [Proteobacteria bacterium]|nr:NAD(P)-dependent oxidoreductase [Pseudomonadota bacterium]
MGTNVCFFKRKSKRYFKILGIYMAKIGICGTGKMGSEIAKRLIDCKQEVTVWNRTKSKAELLISDGVNIAANIPELVKNNDIIFNIMGDDLALDYIYNSKEGINNCDLSNKIIIELSTTSVDKIKSISKIITNLNGSFIECPVGGSTKPARDGNLFGLVGGDKKTFYKIEHILKLICRRCEYLGEIGKGASMKLAINLPLMVYWQALGEAMSIATNSGIKFEKALDIMIDSSGAAKVAHLKVDTMIQAMKNESNLLSTFSTSSSLKDMTLMLEEGKKNGNDLHVLHSAKSYVEKAINDGWSEHDASLMSVYINKKNLTQ